jgi:rod shape-determining protein MreC
MVGTTIWDRVDSEGSERLADTELVDDGPDIALRGQWPISSYAAKPADSERSISTESNLVTNPRSTWLAAKARVRSLRPSAVLALLILTAAVLMILDLRGGPTDLLRSAGQSIGGPAQDWADRIVGPLRQTPLRRVDESALLARIADLETRNGALERQSGVLADQLGKATQLQGLQAWAEAASIEIVPGRVVAGGSGRIPGRLVAIDVGSSAGLSPNMAVVSQGALVGRLVQVGPSSSSVQLVTDPVSRVGARVQESRESLVASGSGADIDGLFLEPFAPVAVGQTLVTMGSPQSTPYPPGLPIATISQIAGDLGQPDRRVVATPIADLSSLETVGVVVNAKAGDRG